MRKKLMCSLLSLLLIFSTFSAITVIAAEEIRVVLDGQELYFDVPPQLINNRTMVPMRKIFEAMGASVEWEGTTQTINAKKNDVTITMQIDNKTIVVNGKEIVLDVPPQLVDNRTLVPARAVAESLNAKVDWDGNNQIVNINTNLSATNNNVPTGFIDGYEFATFNKFNSNASENGLGGANIYLNCTLDKIDYMDNNSEKTIIGFLTGEDGNKWLVLLHTTFVVNENEYNSILGKPIVLCGIYEGYSSVYSMPALTLTELCVKNTGEIKSGMGKIAYQDKQPDIPNSENKVLETAQDIENYLNEKYSNITTVAGKTEFDFWVIKNDSSYVGYDYSINAKYDYLFFSDIAHSLSLSREQKETAKNELREFQKQIATDLIKLLPNKKLEGCYYHSYYKYPNIKEGFTQVNAYEWCNYETSYTGDLDEIYYNSTVSEFKWTNDKFIYEY